MSYRTLLRVLLCGLLFCTTVAEAKRKRQGGETVPITGRVTDSENQALGGVEVVLEAYHRKLDLRRMKRRDTDLLRVVATTDADGRFRLDWAWNEHYRVFHLAAALPVRRQGRAELDVFSRVEITSPMRAGGAVRQDLTVENASAMRWLQSFISGQSSAAESQVYQQMGRPDKVDPPDESGETAWWYFEVGKVYRFRAGELDQVIEFTPVKGL